MHSPEFLQIGIYIFLTILCSPLLGIWIAKVMSGEIFRDFDFLGRFEKGLYRFLGVNDQEQMNWKAYSMALLWLHLLGGLVVFLLQMFQKYLPLNPQKLSAPSWDLSLNTAVSFLTNTNWQAYSGEATLSYLTQMMGLGVQNFLSAATGIAVLIVLVRGFVNHGLRGLGNFWVDIVRATLFILLPMSVVLSILLTHQGVIQNFEPYKVVTTLEGKKQLIPGGPVASQVAIKQLGTNGGGYFNANSAHPFENPTPLSNFLEMLSILLIPAAIPFAFGRMVGSLKQGGLLFTVMTFLWLIGLGGSFYSEYSHKEALSLSATMEGKEGRFGVVNSVLWSSVTTAASNGSTNAALSSLSPIAGGISLFNILSGEVIFGGVGSGMYGLLLFVILTVFISGLMVGRSPEFLGKKLESFEMKWTIFGILSPSIVILIGMSVSLLLPTISLNLLHGGPHGFSELLYAWASAAGNNGSAFGGFGADTLFNNIGLSIAMLVGRFAVLIPVLAIAGSLSAKKMIPESSGTFATDTPIFATLLVGVILVVGALTFLPALILGPIIEHLVMLLGQLY